MSTTPETTGTLRVVWDDNDENRRVVHFDVDYEIGAFEPGDCFSSTPAVGGGFAILDVRVKAVFQYACTNTEKLTRDYRSSPQFTYLEDACRKHAGREV